MKNNRLVTIAASVVALIVIAFVALYFAPQKNQPATTAGVSDLVDGTHYRMLSEPLSVTTDGVSVVEFFWYGCPHCQAFEPRIKEWLASAPEDINFELKPVVWNDATRLHGAMYYVGRTAERPAQLHEALFEQIIEMRQERNLDRQIEMASGLFADHGVEADALRALLKGQQILSLVKLAEQDMRSAEISSTPTLLIGGKYVLLNNEAVAEKGVFEVVDALVDLARQ